MSESVRSPAVAGRFYPADAADLRDSVLSLLGPKEIVEKRCIGCVVPHAGYIYSGHTAGLVFRTIEIPDRVVILCPNHTGRGAPIAIMSEGYWQTPLGKVALASGLAQELTTVFPLISEDSAAHQYEHAIEVELPFLQMINEGVRIVPIAIGTRRPDVLQALGTVIAQTIRKQSDPILIIASSDFNHYESEAITQVKDAAAIEKILALDAAGLGDVVERENISMCGAGPVVTMLHAAKALRGTKAELLEHTTSARASGDETRVVGYAGIVVE